jgi:hypothetical protein
MIASYLGSLSGMRIFTLVIFSFIATLCNAGRLDKIDPSFNDQPNPFMQVLGLSGHRISLNRDSTRLKLKDGHIDLILAKKKLWNLSRYDRNGNKVDIGSFRNGTGTVRLEMYNSIHEANFENGILEGPATKTSSPRRNPWYELNFKEGLLDGDSYSWSFWDSRHRTSITTYSKGHVLRHEQYGLLRRWVSMFMMRPQVIRTDFLCSRTIYDKGRPVSHECFVPKCRRCAF